MCNVFSRWFLVNILFPLPAYFDGVQSLSERLNELQATDHSSKNVGSSFPKLFVYSDKANYSELNDPERELERSQGNCLCPETSAGNALQTQEFCERQNSTINTASKPGETSSREKPMLTSEPFVHGMTAPHFPPDIDPENLEQIKISDLCVRCSATSPNEANGISMKKDANGSSMNDHQNRAVTAIETPETAGLSFNDRTDEHLVNKSCVNHLLTVKQSKDDRTKQSPHSLSFNERKDRANVQPDGSVTKRKLLKTRLKKIVTKKVTKIGKDGRVVEFFTTEEVPESEVSNVAALQLGFHGVQEDPFAPVESKNHLLLGVYTDTIEEEPEFETDIKTEHEKLADERLVERKICSTRQCRKIIKRIVFLSRGTEEQMTNDYGILLQERDRTTDLPPPSTAHSSENVQESAVIENSKAELKELILSRPAYDSNALETVENAVVMLTRNSELENTEKTENII